MSALSTGTAAELVPGDVDGVEALARQLGTFAHAAADVSGQLRDVHAGSWVGPAGDAFRTQIGDLPTRLDRAAAAFGAAQRALDAYADALRDARAAATRAIALHDEGDLATARWRTAQADHARAETAVRSRALAAGLPDPGPLPGAPSSHDPGDDERAGARRLLDDARSRVDDAGRSAAGRLRSASEHAPREPSVLSRAMHQVGQFLAGAGEATWDLLELGFKLSPTYALIDPQGFVEHASGLGQGIVYGVQNPKEFAKAVLDWDTWAENPARALGHLVPDLLLTLATAGAGAAGRGARGVDAAADLNRARRGLDAADDAAPLGRLADDVPRTPYDSLVDPQVAPHNRSIVPDDYDHLGGHPDAESFAEEFFGPTGNPDYPMDWRWPANDGAVPGTETFVQPTPGTRIDRIGGLGGDFFTDPGTPFPQRSLPPDRLEFPRRVWEVDASHPSFSDGTVRLERSDVAPWFGQPGGGAQYRFIDPATGKPLSNQEALTRGLIQEVTGGS